LRDDPRRLNCCNCARLNSRPHTVQMVKFRTSLW
jgi:hypothetical protein